MYYQRLMEAYCKYCPAVPDTYKHAPARILTQRHQKRSDVEGGQEVQGSEKVVQHRAHNYRCPWSAILRTRETVR